GAQAIAIAQADHGDLRGARETGAVLADHDQVEQAISRYQIRSGDMEGALATFAAMPSGQDVNWLIELSEVPVNADDKNLRKLALRIQNQQVDTKKDERWKWRKVWAEHFLAGAFCSCNASAEALVRARKKTKNMSPASACQGAMTIDFSNESWYRVLQTY